VVGHTGLEVDEPVGERWELAIELLTSGADGVTIGSLALRRDTYGPNATGQVAVDIYASRDPKSLTMRGAVDDVDRGLDQLAVLSSDARFAAPVADHGCVIEYVHDDGTGTVRLASVSPDRSVTWDEHSGATHDCSTGGPRPGNIAPVDASYYDDIRGRLMGLLIRLSDRLEAWTLGEAQDFLEHTNSGSPSR